MARSEAVVRPVDEDLGGVQDPRAFADHPGEVPEQSRGFGAKQLLLFGAAAAAAFHVGWAASTLSALACVYAWALIQISAGKSAALSFRFGFLAGFLVFGPQLAWFWNIFGIASVCLWAVLSVFTGVFTAVLHCLRQRAGSRFLALAAPMLWTGIEYFRSECYFLKFSWMSVGYLFSDGSGIIPTGMLGVYGTGFTVFMLAAAFEKRSIALKVGLLLMLTLLLNWPPSSITQRERGMKVAGMQLEFPAELEVPAQLDRVLAAHPDAEILVLSEYTFDGTIPRRVREWCQQEGKYLVAGGKEEVFESGKNTFRNTAFVVGPTGEIIFQQGKSVPIQFFHDGLPASAQKVWDSPWGRIAIPTCYDLSYRRVTDEFVAQGAEAFIVPFMDVETWGERQHRQHSRIAPVRAREYGLEMFRLGSSGISQHVDAGGNVIAQTGFPGQEETLGGRLEMNKGRLPLDHWMAPACSLLAGITVLALVAEWCRRELRKQWRRRGA